MTDEDEIEKAAKIIRADVLSTRSANELARELLALHLAKIKELEAENAASMREIALARERADKAEGEVAALRKQLVIDEAMLERAWTAYGTEVFGDMRAALAAALGKDGDNG